MKARSAADRLRRLRRLLTWLFTAVNAAGLIVFAWLAVTADARQGEQRLDGGNQVVTSTVARLIQYDATLVTAYVSADPINDQCPQFAVLQGGAGSFPSYYSARACIAADPAVLGGLAHDAAQSGRVQYGNVDVGGGVARVRAEPFRNNSGQYIGAIVVVADAGPTQAAHTRFTLLVTGGSVVLIAVLALAGHLLSSRAIKPAADALEQQQTLLDETAHDLRTPVAALRALAETALHNPDQQAELLPRTVALAAQMGGIIESQLMRARLAAGLRELTIEPVMLDQLVTDVVENTPDDGAIVTVTAAPSQVRADASLIRRAIGNLVDNALHHGHYPGQPAIVHVTVAGGRVTVADHGPGVDPGIADDLLDRFRTGSGSTGLGLSIVRWVAQIHGGTLNVYNADEGGAIFELALPAM
ncbi:sensor histidine kinase KdpD [Amycolatopsis sp. GM8]|uniref:sensor histidine kinase n=1 Tax=Amycolatopsis sp. GM8 TaxID=2896530 RepID=UPI001F1FA8DD|nr:HAMP domain-containing sensor histidine kinase [Amycolatopsis sp. GM8]